MNEVSRQQGWGFVDGFEQVAIGDNAGRLAALKARRRRRCVVDVGSALISPTRRRAASSCASAAWRRFHLHVSFATTRMAKKPTDLT